MAKGDGSIVEVKKKDGTSYRPKHWKVRVDCGFDSITKKRRIITRTVSGTKADACKVRDQIKEELDVGLTIDGENMTFGEFALQWQETRETAAEISRTRLTRERSLMEFLVSYLDQVRLRDITPQMIETLYTKIRQDRTEAHGNCSGTTMNMYHKLLKMIMAKAVDYNLILRNPLDKVKAPRCETPDRRSLTTEEARELLAKIDEAENEAYENRIGVERRQDARGDVSERSYLRGLSTIGNVIAARIGLATGMRRGEVVALTWEHVDLKSGTIRVAQSLTMYDEVKEPKSEAGKRTLNIDSNTVAHLEKWKGFQAQEMQLLGMTQSEKTPVCCSDKAAFLKVTNFSRWWRSFCTLHGFEGLKFHELRHTQATQLIANGVDLKTVQTRLGHASPTLTMSFYAHALPEQDRQAAALIGDLFSQPAVKEKRSGTRGRQRKTAHNKPLRVSSNSVS